MPGRRCRCPTPTAGTCFCGHLSRETHGRKNEIASRDGDEGQLRAPPRTARAARPDSGKLIAVIYRGNHTESCCLDISMKFRSKVKNCFSQHAPKCRNKQEKQASLLLIHFPRCQSSTEPQVGNINDAPSGLGNAARPQGPLSTPASNTGRAEGIALCLPLLTEHFCRCIPFFKCPRVTYLSPNVISCSWFSANRLAV